MDEGPEFIPGLFLVRSNSLFRLHNSGQLSKRRSPAQAAAGLAFATETGHGTL